MRVFTAAAATALGTTAMLASLATPVGASTTSATPLGGGGDKHRQHSGSARLDGRQEVPPNNSRGSGHFRYRIKGHTLCYKLSVRKTAKPIGAHIHVGPRGENGPIIVTLKTPPKNGKVHDCIRARRDQNPRNAATVLTKWELEGIKKDAFFFYVNVHTVRFPDGEIRGQLTAHRKAWELG
jgi:hypothetical protein